MNKHMTEVQIQNEQIKDAILDALRSCGPATIMEINNYSSELSRYSNQRVSTLVRRLVEEEKITKTVYRGKSYFSLGGLTTDDYKKLR